MTEHFNKVAEIMDDLSRTHEPATIFNDLLTAIICTYHSTNIQSQLKVKDPENEKIYMGIVEKYGAETIRIFPKILAHLQLQALEFQYSDLLGEYFMQNISKGKNGQFFTPVPICDLIVELNHEPNLSNKTVLDPACGSGRMLMAFAAANPDNYFFGADNNNTCAKMSTVNLLLSGMRGEVAWMDTIAMEWFGGWHINTQGFGIIPIEKEQSRIWSAPELKEKSISPHGSFSRNKGNQLDLF